eukprot:TRINITY_DN43159_c0_g1_i1.p1 TRINITY_DN43159_c0_g1~~TRINITY_DN43159_c0_g1_i1.p1  ORF type:complete len:248 (+),score=61.34 TRINITY_DN43159_c0_g1_i1:92-835(+)
MAAADHTPGEKLTNTYSIGPGDLPAAEKLKDTVAAAAEKARSAAAAVVGSASDRFPEKVAVTGHHEDSGHTYYHVVCTDSQSKRWVLSRRLTDFRHRLHDPVKAALGGDYSQLFARTRFAQYGGIPGTTQRLDEWLRTLLSLLHSGMIPEGGAETAAKFLANTSDDAGFQTPRDRAASTPAAVSHVASSFVPSILRRKHDPYKAGAAAAAEWEASVASWTVTPQSPKKPSESEQKPPPPGVRHALLT